MFDLSQLGGSEVLAHSGSTVVGLASPHLTRVGPATAFNICGSSRPVKGRALRVDAQRPERFMVFDRLDATTYPRGNGPADPLPDETLQGVLQRVDPEHVLTRPEETFIFSEYDQRIITVCGQFAAGTLIALARAAVRLQIPDSNGQGARSFPVSVRTLSAWSGLDQKTVRAALHRLDWFVTLGPNPVTRYTPRTLNLRLPFSLLAGDQVALVDFIARRLRGQPFKGIRADLRSLGQLTHHELVAAVLPPVTDLTPHSTSGAGQRPLRLSELVAEGLGVPWHHLKDLESEIRLLATTLHGADIPLAASLIDDWMPLHGPFLILALLELQRRRQQGQLDHVIPHQTFATAIGASVRQVQNWALEWPQGKGRFTELAPFVSDLQMVRGGIRVSGLFSRLALPAATSSPARAAQDDPEAESPREAGTTSPTNSLPIPMWVPADTDDYSAAIEAIPLEWKDLRPHWKKHVELKGNGTDKPARRDLLASRPELLPAIAIEYLLGGYDQAFLMACRNLLEFASGPLTTLSGDVLRTVQLGPALTLDALQQLASPDLPAWEAARPVAGLVANWCRRARPRLGAHKMTLPEAAQTLITDLGLVAVGEDLRRAQVAFRDRAEQAREVEQGPVEEQGGADAFEDAIDREAARREALWEKVLEQMRMELPHATVDAFLANAWVTEWSRERVAVEVKAAHQLQVIDTRLRKALRRNIKSVDDQAGDLAVALRLAPTLPLDLSDPVQTR